jgi:hypothetical protein
MKENFLSFVLTQKMKSSESEELAIMCILCENKYCNC